jgi:hypothetical protein
MMMMIPASPSRAARAALCLLLLLLFPRLPAQEAPDLLDRDFDSLFDAPLPAPDSGRDAEPGDAAAPLALSGPGFALDLAYNANGGFSPGLSETPWAGETPIYSQVLGAKLNAYLGLDVRLSDSFRAKSTLAFSVPGSGLSLSEFFLDYSVARRLFFRAGAFALSWGLSPNFPAADLLSRLPPGNSGGDPYILKLDVPFGVGGFQFVALTRAGFMHGPTPGFGEIGYGAKYNLALPAADIDLGFFYHREMPLRAFAALKSTVKDTELYLEAAGAVRHDSWSDAALSGTVGFFRSFFGGSLSLNGELFWNGESGAAWYKPKTDIEDAEAPAFIPGLNAAFNVGFAPGLPANLRFFLRALWAWEHNTFHLTPGLSASPLPHLSIAFAFPVALGARDGHYYRNNPDTANRPFSVALLLTLSGSFRFAHYK